MKIFNLKYLKILFSERDIRFHYYRKYSFLIGKISTNIDKIFYGKRLLIQSPFFVWGNIRFLIFGGPGSIKIGRNFHAVSSRKRSFITLYSPCQLTTIGAGQIIIGNNVDLNGTAITAAKRISIGDNTLIGPNTIIIDHDGHVSWPPQNRGNSLGIIEDIVIGDNVWIGMNCLILKGVTVGDGTVIAAGSIVINDLDANSLYAGNPAKKVKSFID